MTKVSKHSFFGVSPNYPHGTGRRKITESDGPPKVDGGFITVWKEIAGPLVPVLITAIIGVTGITINNKYNDASLAAAKTKNAADIQIAKISSGLAYVKQLASFRKKDEPIKRQTQIIVAPSLPPESAFTLAVDELPGNPGVLDELMRTDSTHWRYLVPNLEFTPFKYIDEPRIHYSSDEIAKNQFYVERRNVLLQYLQQRNLLNRFFTEYLLSPDYDSDSHLNALINYLDFVYNADKIDQCDGSDAPCIIKSDELEHRIQRYLRYTTTSNKIHMWLAKAAELVIDQHGAHQALIPYAAEYFWESYDIRRGESPSRASLDYFLITHRFRTLDTAFVASFDPHHRYADLISSQGTDGFIRTIQAQPAHHGKIFIDENTFNKHLTETGIVGLNKYLNVRMDTLNLPDIPIEELIDIQLAYCTVPIGSSPDLNRPYLTSQQTYKLVCRIVHSLETKDQQIKYNKALCKTGFKLIHNNLRDRKWDQLLADSLMKWYIHSGMVYVKTGEAGFAEDLVAEVHRQFPKIQVPHNGDPFGANHRRENLKPIAILKPQKMF